MILTNVSPLGKISCYSPHCYGVDRLNQNNFSLFNSLKTTFSKWPRVDI